MNDTTSLENAHDLLLKLSQYGPDKSDYDVELLRALIESSPTMQRKPNIGIDIAQRYYVHLFNSRLP